MEGLVVLDDFDFGLDGERALDDFGDRLDRAIAVYAPHEVSWYRRDVDLQANRGLLDLFQVQQVLNRRPLLGVSLHAQPANGS